MTLNDLTSFAVIFMVVSGLGFTLSTYYCWCKPRWAERARARAAAARRSAATRRSSSPISLRDALGAPVIPEEPGGDAADEEPRRYRAPLEFLSGDPAGPSAPWPAFPEPVADPSRQASGSGRRSARLSRPSRRPTTPEEGEEARQPQG